MGVSWGLETTLPPFFVTYPYVKFYCDPPFKMPGIQDCFYNNFHEVKRAYGVPFTIAYLYIAFLVTGLLLLRTLRTCILIHVFLFPLFPFF